MREHRVTTRIEEHTDVSVKFQSSPEERSLEGKVYPFHSLDVSLHGVRLEVDIPVPIGALLELEIRLHNTRKRYRHVGDVVWADAIYDDDMEDSNLHDVGIRFHTNTNPQFDSWTRAVAAL